MEAGRIEVQCSTGLQKTEDIHLPALKEALVGK
jgi:hypothetical protein